MIQKNNTNKPKQPVIIMTMSCQQPRYFYDRTINGGTTKAMMIQELVTRIVVQQRQEIKDSRSVSLTCSVKNNTFSHGLSKRFPVVCGNLTGLEKQKLLHFKQPFSEMTNYVTKIHHIII